MDRKLSSQKNYDIFHIFDQIQGVPRNMTVGEQFECLLPLFVRLFDTKENNKNIIWESCYSKIEFKVKYIQAKDLLTE